MKSLIVAVGLFGLTATAACAQAPGPANSPPGPERPKLDANGDGKVTLAEFQAMAAMRFARMDTNKDGRITKDEWLAGRHGGRGGPADGAGMPPPPPGAAPPQGSPDGRGPDGKGHRGMGGHHGGGGDMRGMTFAQMDLNDDGVVSREESERAAKRLFTFLDTNEDGVLSGKELPMMGRGGRGMGGPRPQ